MNKKTAIIIGAGPSGLTAAYELLEKSDIKPIIFEMTGDIGGLSKTVNYKGNRIDIGGHRFFSKSKKVLQWWTNILPLQGAPSKDDIILERDVTLSKEVDAPDPEKTDEVMLTRSRVSRIFFGDKFFDYPISLNLNTLVNLGVMRTIKIAASYIRARICPRRQKNSLEDFFINRFGKELYFTFFKDYTQKVWGIPCHKIGPEWGAQRIKGLSVTKAILDAARRIVIKDSSIEQRNTETSLINQFMYPKFGPGQMWESVAKIIEKKGGKIHLKHRIIGLELNDDKIVNVKVRKESTGAVTTKDADYFFSTMPVQELIKSFGDAVPQDIHQVAQGLMYRDFITVGLLVKKLKIKNKTKIETINNIIPDNWIYIQEKSVKLGRVQIYNNWNPYMVKDENTVWLGLEFFCNEGDELWNMSVGDFTAFAISELAKIDIINKEDVLDSIIVKLPKAYPAYFGTYNHFDKIRKFTDKIENLFLIGRNGMHRYNNQDHSMLTAMIAVENVIKSIRSKNNIWAVCAEAETET